ncbi:DUF1351 domain-containing protein [Melissococcus plutonius]|uniref:DUF1351 domain-containing protein n=3 Tax=Melissococcus plutonius TaxID=33970 RepID=UPI003C301AE9
MNELKEFELTENSLVIDIGSIQFPAFQQIKNSATKLANYIEKVEVTEENVKESKKLVASVSKQVKNLNDERIKVKRQILEPYDEFEEQVKEITDIVKVSEEIVRQQIRQLEEQERDKKEQAIIDLFNKRIKQYDFKELFTSKDFIKNSHLNKTYTLSKVEKEMVEWLEQIDQALTTIKNLEHTDEIFVEYKITQDLAQAISIVQQRHLAIKASKQIIDTDIIDNYKITYIIENQKDANMLELFMQKNNIKFEKVGNE